MKKVSLTFFWVLGFLASAVPAFAQTTIQTCATGQFSVLCSLDSSKLGTVIGTAITIILIIATVIALFFLLWGGLRWIFSGGEKGKVDEARKTIIAALVGLVITFLAYFILTIVLGFFGLSLNNLVLPKFTAG